MGTNTEAVGDMRAFVRVVERQSFSAAAEDLSLTPSAVSRLVARLEDRLGARLLYRTTRRLSLTSEGELYFARARQIVSDIDEAEAEVARSRAAPRGHLHVNTSNAFATHQLAPVLPAFLVRYPDITVELSVTDRVVDLVEDYADVTIRAGRIPDTTLSARKIAEVARVICAAPSYLAQYGTPRVPADLAKHVCISLAVGEATIRYPCARNERQRRSRPSTRVRWSRDRPSRRSARRRADPSWHAGAAIGRRSPRGAHRTICRLSRRPTSHAQSARISRLPDRKVLASTMAARRNKSIIWSPACPPTWSPFRRCCPTFVCRLCGRP